MDDLGVELNMDVLDDNPEALFDFLTIKSLQDRFNAAPTTQKKPVPRKPIENEAVYQNEAEFETYVQQFPIDDSIAACFALATETESNPQPTAKFVSGGKRPQVSSKYNKLKKKFGWKQSTDESLPADEDFLSRDSKRSKKGGVFSKRHKWRGLGGSKKAVLFSGQSPSPNTVDVKEDIAPRALDLSPNDSNSISDSQITSYSETLTSDDQTVPLMKGDHSSSKNGFTQSGMLGVVNYGADVYSGEEDFLSIFTGDTTTIIQNLEDIHPDDAATLRDSHGNTLLHHAVTIGNADAVKFMLEKFPDMTSDMNNDNTTAVEVATKHGKYDCLRVMLERNQRRKSLGPSLINRLLNISAQNGQGECLNLLLTYLSRDPQTISSLPGDTRGNTAAHLAAKNGHLHCLQILMAAGYDVTSENLIRQRPLHIAHQNRNETCFSYLLLLDVCEELLRINKSQTNPSLSHGDVTSGLHSSLEQINATLNRYSTLLSNSRQSLDESRDGILQTLVLLQNDLDLFIKHTDCDTAYKRKEARKKLDELRGEIERLEDIFEFSPIAEMEGTITKLLVDVDNTLKPITDRLEGRDISPHNLEVSMTEDEIGHILSSLVKDIYKEFMLENWNVGHVFERYLGALRSKNGSDVIHNTSSEFDTSDTERFTSYGPTRKNVSANSKPYRNISVDTQACQTDFKETTCQNCQILQRNKDDTRDESESEIDIEQEEGSETREIKEAFSGAKSETLNDKAHVKLNNEFVKSDDIINAKVDDVMHGGDTSNKMAPTERPFAKLLSLDERMELLISGERSRSKLTASPDTLVDKSASPEVPESMYTTTFTSITSDSTSGLSDWYSKLGFSSLDTSPDDVTHDVTSETPSYWWDVGDDRGKAEGSIFRKEDSFRETIRRQIHLNLENEDSSLEELRRHRLLNHLQSVQQTRYPSSKYTEKITTASGEVIGGFPSRGTDETIGLFSPRGTSEKIGEFPSRGIGEVNGGMASRDETTKIVVDVNGALQRRHESKAETARNHDHNDLFTLEDAINSNQSGTEEFYGRYNVRSRDVFEASPGDRWDDTSFTDDDDSRSIPWYEIEDIGQAIRWKSDTETSDGTLTPQSYV